MHSESFGYEEKSMMKKVYASYPGYTEKIKKYGLLGFRLVR